MLRFHVRSC